MEYSVEPLPAPEMILPFECNEGNFQNLYASGLDETFHCQGNAYPAAKTAKSRDYTDTENQLTLTVTQSSKPKSSSINCQKISKQTVCRAPTVSNSLSDPGETTVKQPKKRGPKKKPLTKEREARLKTRRVRANTRERSRMHGLNHALELLRSHVPTFSTNQRLSKIETLRLAKNYIRCLSDLLTCCEAPTPLQLAQTLTEGLSQNTCNLIATTLQVNPRALFQFTQQRQSLSMTLNSTDSEDASIMTMSPVASDYNNRLSHHHHQQQQQTLPNFQCSNGIPGHLANETVDPRSDFDADPTNGYNPPVVFHQLTNQNPVYLQSVDRFETTPGDSFVQQTSRSNIGVPVSLTTTVIPPINPLPFTHPEIGYQMSSVFPSYYPPSPGLVSPPLGYPTQCHHSEMTQQMTYSGNPSFNGFLPNMR